MATELMPNGQVIEYDDNISKEALERIRKANGGGTRKAKVAAGQPRKSDTILGHKEGTWEYATLKKADDTVRALANGLTFGLADKFAAGADTVFRTGGGGSFNDQLERQKQLSTEAYDRSPILSTAGEVGGALLNPVGAGAKGLQWLGRGAELIGAERAAAALGNASTRVANSGALAQGALAGMNQGALNAAGHSGNLSEVGANAVNGGLTGGLAGGALGGLFGLGRRGFQIFKDRTGSQITRNAYEHIDDMMQAGRITPEQAEQQLRASIDNGGDMIVADLSPGLRARNTNLVRKPHLRGADEAIERSEMRNAARPGRFSDKVKEYSGVSDDAVQYGDDINAMRKRQGQRDFEESGVLDQPMQHTDDLQRTLGDSPDFQQAMSKAIEGTRRAGERMPDLIQDVNGSFMSIPSWRVFQRVKAAYDDKMSSLVRAGANNEARDLSTEFNKIKDKIAADNPEFAQAISRQRDFFQQQNALETGQKVLNKLTSSPRVLYKEARNLSPERLQDWRIGAIDALVNWERKGSDPVTFFKNAMAKREQRKVLELMFGGKGNLGRMDRWVNRELKSAKTDFKAAGPQSITAETLMADSGDDAIGGIKNVMLNALRGYGFGGITGMAGNIVGTMGRMAAGTNRATQEEILRILQSKGDDLVPGIEAARKYKAARQASEARAGRNAGKGIQQLITSNMGN